jgi:hypothetical protein
VIQTQGWVDRYHQIGLRRNPFSVEATDELEAGHDAWFLARGLGPAPEPGGSVLVQVIGEKGFGKTTQLSHWRRQRPGPYHYIPAAPYRNRWRPAPVEALVYGDEIDRQARPVRRRWFASLARAGATVVVGTHRDLGPVAKRAGLDVVTHVLEPATLTQLSSIVEARVAAASLDPESVPTLFDDHDLRAIHRQSGGSIRAAQAVCHQLVAERVA